MKQMELINYPDQVKVVMQKYCPIADDNLH